MLCLRVVPPSSTDGLDLPELDYIKMGYSALAFTKGSSQDPSTLTLRSIICEV